ncbi:uncharacterized protein A4U43_C04F7940 [Asparagus officinalis]|uniref:Uncharacterized protein n=1 Tax=Asparagus officinalis TaxID=4686 RepID=A0A5P1F3L3_ASPOF|nr:uncharacterized protein A4U43_C04F7940 [Asparagus officinalis]
MSSRPQSEAGANVVGGVARSVVAGLRDLENGRGLERTEIFENSYRIFDVRKSLKVFDCPWDWDLDFNVPSHVELSPKLLRSRRPTPPNSRTLKLSGSPIEAPTEDLFRSPATKI